MKYFSILTALGEQKIAKATAEGTLLQLTQIAVGDGGGTLPVPSINQTQLIHENYRANINTLKRDGTKRNRVIAELVIPSTVGGWWTREIGLFDSEGDLFAVGNCPETYKPLPTEGAGSEQFIRMVLTISHTEHIAITYDPLVASVTVDVLNKAVTSLNEAINATLSQTIEAHEKSRNHPDATLTEKGFTQLSSDVTSLNETMSATPKAIKIAMDNALARLAKDRNGADIPNPTLFRQNIELGNSATRNIGTTINTVAAGDDRRIIAAQKAIEDTQIGRPNQSVTLINSPDDLSNLPAGARRFAQNAPGVSVLPTNAYFYLEVVAKRDMVNGIGIWAVEANNPGNAWLGTRYNATTTPNFTWAKQYSTLNKPTAADVGTDTTAQINAKVADAKKAGTDAQLTANAAQTAASNAAAAASAANTNANGRVPNTRTVNGKALSTNITLTAADVGAVPTVRTVNGKSLAMNIALTAADVGAVPTARTVNGKSLLTNIILTAADLGIVIPKNTALTAVNGWWKCGDTGLIIQWGIVSANYEGTANYPLPIPFPHAGFWAIGQCYRALSSTTNKNVSSAELFNSAFIRVTLDSGTPTAWIAIGY